MELVNPKVQQYAEQFSSPEDDLLREINDWTVNHHPEQQMLSATCRVK
ncbi:MAG: hypothetical protein WDO71_02590 [Bacteroidota bacterium]